MNKIKNILMALTIIVTSSIFVSGTNIGASVFVTTVPELFDGISVTDKVENKLIQLGYIYVNEELVYCIEPLKIAINGAVMIPEGTLSEEKKEKISLISYMGYGEERKSNLWYVATQILIWETLGYDLQVNGFEDYSNYKQEILERVDNHSLLPSFANEIIHLKKGEEKTIYDTNQVLTLFKDISSTNTDFELKRNGNQLSIRSNTNRKTSGEIRFKKFKETDLGLAVVYVGKDNKNTQALIRTHISTNLEGTLSILNQSFGKVVFHKVGESIKGVEKRESDYGDVYELKYQLENMNDTVFHVFAKKDIRDVNGYIVYNKDELVDTLVSYKGGVKSKELYSGSYYAKEVKTSFDHTLNPRIIEFEIVENEIDVIVKPFYFVNKRSKMQLNFVKELEQHSNVSNEALYKEVVFGVYSIEPIYNDKNEILVDKDQLIFVSNLTSDGKLEQQPNLPFGSYYLKELQTHEDYVLDKETYFFDVYGENEEIIQLTLHKDKLINELIRLKLSIKKVDEKTKNSLQATFALLDKDMKTVVEFETDKNGVGVVENLVNGTYYLKEIIAPKYYELDSQLKEIVIKGKDVDLEITNKKIEEKKVLVETADSTKKKQLAWIAMLSLTILTSMKIKRCFCLKNKV